MDMEMWRRGNVKREQSVGPTNEEIPKQPPDLAE
jgi:hypothetical protein